MEHFTWSTVPEQVKRWAEEVKLDVDTPDLWAALGRKQDVITGSRFEGVANTLFAPDEQAEIAENIRETKEYLRQTYSLSEERMLSLEAKLDNIAAAASRIGRRDWELLVYGTMFSLIVNGLLPPENVRQILLVVLGGLVQLVGGGAPPQLPPVSGGPPLW